MSFETKTQNRPLSRPSFETKTQNRPLSRPLYNLLARTIKSLDEEYYNMPWEYDADMRGKVTRDCHSPFASRNASAYFDLWW